MAWLVAAASKTAAARRSGRKRASDRAIEPTAERKQRDGSGRQTSLAGASSKVEAAA
jgi:hypothetical protein